MKLNFTYNQSIEECKETCQALNSENGCNAIIFDSSNETCALLAFPKAIPNPDKAKSGSDIQMQAQDSWVGYYLSTDDSLPQKGKFAKNQNVKTWALYNFNLNNYIYIEIVVLIFANTSTTRV